MNKQDISKEIQQIFDNNELEDLKIFIKKRHCLNNFNISLMYIFHIVQSVGILTTTLAAGYNQVYLIWIGVSLNVLASLINVFEKNNNTMLKKLMIDIKKIKDGNFIDESPIIEIDSDKPGSLKDHIPEISSNTNSKETLQINELK
jgi:hypothetical protein